MNDKAGSSPRLAGRKVLITGAASGIGRACAELFAEHGASVALLDVDAARLAEVAAASGGAAIPADLLDPAATAAAVARAAEALGGLDGLVNCAGVALVKPLAEISLEEWAKVLAVNLTAPYVLCRAALPHLTAAGGTVVNIASSAGLLPGGAGSTAYSGSKGGLIAFTKALAAELAPKVRANVVCPGLVKTPMTEFMFEGYEDRPLEAPAVARYALKRPAEPLEIARGCLFLTSAESSYVTGATLAIDGGRTFH
jgi:NAD(P)-dependent dehydrogenase (short-subunit alcohol dehydrogenase family)